LSVVPDKPDVGDQAGVPPSTLRNVGPPQGQTKRPLEMIPGADFKPDEKRPPRVIVPLSDIVLEELMPVLLTTTIDAGVPTATVRIHFYSFLKTNTRSEISSGEGKIFKYQLQIPAVEK
jgi:hypothetical protein